MRPDFGRQQDDRQGAENERDAPGADHRASATRSHASATKAGIDRDAGAVYRTRGDGEARGLQPELLQLLTCQVGSLGRRIVQQSEAGFDAFGEIRLGRRVVGGLQAPATARAPVKQPTVRRGADLDRYHLLNRPVGR